MTQAVPSSQPQSAQEKTAVVAVPQVEKTWIEFSTPYLPLFLTIVGWWVVSVQNDRRERRKEIRELIKQVEQRVESIVATTTEYYALDGKDPKCAELSAKIRYNISALDPLRKRIKSAGLECDVVGEIVIFKQSVTGGQFESPSRKKLPGGNANVSESATAGFDLVDKFEKSYFANFPVKSRWAFWGKNENS